MKKTRATFKSAIDGVGTYILWYLWTSFLIWLGIYLIDYIKFSYLQCLGGLIVFRQIRALFIASSNRHLKDKE